tara:strand:+ start:2449 stop:2559 length:111 start_codon:yes stop_codon:yes gene_type:complete
MKMSLTVKTSVDKSEWTAVWQPTSLITLDVPIVDYG